MEKISTAVRGQRWMPDKACMSLWSCWPVMQRRVVLWTRWRRSGKERLLQKVGEIPSCPWNMLGKKQRARWGVRGGGGGGCNILTGNLIDYDDSLMAKDIMNTNVFLCVHSPDGVTGGPSSSPFVQTRQANQRRVSMSLSCRSSQSSNAYLSLADLVLGFTGSKPLSHLDLNHSLLVCSLSKTVQHKCIHCLVSLTWLLSLSSQRPREPSHAYGRKHKWLFFFEIAQREWVMFLIM